MVLKIKMASSNVGGYEHEFLEPSDKLQEFECPLCLYVTREPHLTDCCGQHFCQVCINCIITDRKPCPFCKESSFNAFIDKKQKRKVLQLKIKCTMNERGCDWSGELGKLDTHVGTQNGSCQFVDVNCPNNCGESHQRRHLANHLSDLCPKRPFACTYCLFEATYEQICNGHYPKCVKYPVPCPNNCEIETVERGKLEQHMRECPLQVVDCEFAHAGCSKKIKRKNLPKHMELSVQKHLVLVSSHFQRKLAEKDEQVAVLQGKVRMLEVNCLPLKEPPKEFTLANYSQYEGKHTRVAGPVLCIAPKVQINFTFTITFQVSGFSISPQPRLDVELYQLPGESDDIVNWPVRCTLIATLVNQSSDQHHISSSKDYELSRPTWETCISQDVLVVPYSTKKDYFRRFLKDDDLKFRFHLQLK